MLFIAKKHNLQIKRLEIFKPFTAVNKRILSLLIALFGFALIFVWHIPKLIYSELIASDINAFHYQDYLIASGNEHLLKAKQFLDENKNLLLRYAALGIKFALEITIAKQLQFFDLVSNKTLKKDDPVKMKMAMTLIDPNSDFEHDIYIVKKLTEEKI